LVSEPAIIDELGRLQWFFFEEGEKLWASAFIRDPAINGGISWRTINKE